MSVGVTVDRVSKSFGGVDALRDVSLTVEPGELVALLGPSGSGKTTLLRLIAGLENVQSGHILIGDIDTTQLSLRDRRIGFVFQHYALFRHMSVADNIAFGLRAKPRKFRPPSREIARRVGELLDLVQLAGFEKRFPTQLSGGQRQRVALARALAIEPRVLLLDEPFGALDAKVRKDLRRWLRDLHLRTGHTTLFVTHDQEEALELSDRVAILNRGAMEQVGTSDDVYDRPASQFVCEFLGEANRLNVAIDQGSVSFADRIVPGLDAAGMAGAATLYVRPHLAQIVASADAALAGRVALVTRNGAQRRAEVTIEGLERPFQIDLGSARAPVVGTTVGIRIQEGHLFAAARPGSGA